MAILTIFAFCIHVWYFRFVFQLTELDTKHNGTLQKQNPREGSHILILPLHVLINPREVKQNLSQFLGRTYLKLELRLREKRLQRFTNHNNKRASWTLNGRYHPEQNCDFFTWAVLLLVNDNPCSRLSQDLSFWPSLSLSKPSHKALNIFDIQSATSWNQGLLNCWRRKTLLKAVFF